MQYPTSFPSTNSDSSLLQILEDKSYRTNFQELQDLTNKIDTTNRKCENMIRNYEFNKKMTYIKNKVGSLLGLAPSKSLDELLTIQVAYLKNLINTSTKLDNKINQELKKLNPKLNNTITQYYKNLETTELESEKLRKSIEKYNNQLKIFNETKNAENEQSFVDSYRNRTDSFFQTEIEKTKTYNSKMSKMLLFKTETMLRIYKYSNILVQEKAKSLKLNLETVKASIINMNEATKTIASTVNVMENAKLFASEIHGTLEYGLEKIGNLYNDEFIE
jgi:hypothetical protein